MGRSFGWNEELNVESHLENFTIKVQDGKKMLQISPEGKLTIHDCKEQGVFIVKDALGKIIFSTGQRDASLDEEDGCEKTIQLQSGFGIRGILHDDKGFFAGTIKIAYDKAVITKLKSKRGSSKNFAGKLVRDENIRNLGGEELVEGELNIESREEQERMDKVVEFGAGSVCYCSSFRFGDRGKLVKNEWTKGKLNIESYLENFILSSQDGKTMLKISPEGKLTINNCKKDWSVFVVDRSGKTIFDTESKEDREGVWLNPGYCIDLLFYEDEGKGVVNQSCLIKYDERIQLESKVDGFKNCFSLSRWFDSEVVESGLVCSEIVELDGGESARIKIRRKIYLEESKTEIMLLSYFFKLNRSEFDEKGTKELFSKLPIADHAGLLASLNTHCGGYCSDFYQSLRTKIFRFLEKEKRQFGVSYLCTSQACLEGVLPKAKKIIDSILVNISINSIQEISLNPSGRILALQYEGGRAEIIDLENRRVLFGGDKVTKLSRINTEGIFYEIKYKNGEKRIIDIKKGVSILQNQDEVDGGLLISKDFGQGKYKFCRNDRLLGMV